MTPQQIDAMKLALECAERCEAIDGMYSWSETITAIKETLAEHAMQEVQRLGQEIEQEPVAWRNAAIRVGEDLSSVGPDGYYDMTAQQWLDWAMEQQPHGKNSLAQPEQEPVADDIASILACRDMLDAQPVPEVDRVIWPEHAEQEPVFTYEQVKAHIQVAMMSTTTPPQRTWVGLTDDEIALIHADNPHPQGFARAILAKSKEKNA